MDSDTPDNNSRELDLDAALSDERWVPCLYWQDEYCRHIVCQGMEPAQDDDDLIVRDDEPKI